MDKNSVPTLWLIPARGGSKGIPRKNIRDFCGKSLVARALEQAEKCASPEDEIVVSSDSAEIAEEAGRYGHKPPFLRPENLASDTASSYDVIIHALDEFKKQGKEFKRVVLLQPTSPLRLTQDIQNALALWNPKIDMVVTVSEAKTNPYYNAFETDKDGFLKISKGEGGFTRRQDAPHVWEYNGAVYVMTVASLEKEPMSKFKKIVPSEMEASRSIDLDTPTDWMVAELLFKEMIKNNG